jgi:hypothetical protein
MVVCTCHPSYEGGISRRVEVQASQDINMRPYLKKYLKQKGLGTPA